jgi:DnaJ homolog subfamily C member 17
MPNDDLLTHATSSLDFYAFLELKSTATESDIKRGYRRAALKYHPDKVGDDAEAKEKFHWIGIANAVLLDPAARAAYDAAREAKARQQREREKLEEGRRKMAEALEKGERQNKRIKIVDGVEDAEERLQREIRRIQEANRKMMGEKMRMKAEELDVLEEQVRKDKEQEEKERVESEKKNGVREQVGGTAVDALERTVKVKWRREGLGVSLDREGLPTLFSRFGKVQHASSNRDKDKRQRLGDSKEKKVIATGFVVFESIVGAHVAVEDAHKQKGQGDEWDVVESVQWQKEPDFRQKHESSPPARDEPTPAAAPSTPKSKFRSGAHFALSGMANGSSPFQTNGQGLKKVPSFASFSRVASSTPRSSPMANRLGPNSPCLEELTLMRLKEKERERERKKLAEQIEREEQASPDGA